MGEFLTRTDAYEAWLATKLTIDEDGRTAKRARMRDGSAFEFLRATFYRWAELWQAQGFDDAPWVLGVGDLHVENFGTWRDADGRLAWGVNDFDETTHLPYTCDLVRLTVSASLAAPTLDVDTICADVLEGYRAGLVDPTPFVLGEGNGWLRGLYLDLLQAKPDRWEKFARKVLKTDDARPVPEAARRLLEGAMPQPHGNLRYTVRDAGLGSLGRQRFTAVLENWHGGLVVREAKALAPSAWRWAHGEGDSDALFYQETLRRTRRAPDPWLNTEGAWVVRRLAADAEKLKLEDFDAHIDAQLLRAMGAATAHVHVDDALAVQADLARRDPRWLVDATEAMTLATLADRDDCRST